MAEERKIKVGEILVEHGAITQEQLNEALQEQKVSGRFIGEILVARGATSEEQIAKSLSEQLGFAFVDLSNITIEPRAIELVPEELCVEFTAIPLFIMQNIITLAMSNPLEVRAIDEIQSACGLNPDCQGQAPTEITPVRIVVIR